MNLTKLMLVALPVLMLAIAAFCLWNYSWSRAGGPRKGGGGKCKLVALPNGVDVGTHAAGKLSKKADAAIARYLLCKVGTDAAHVDLAGAGELGLFVATDSAAAAEDVLAVQALACADGTVRLTTNGAGALAAGDIVVTAASGKVAKAATTAGTKQYVAGICLEAVAATDGLVFEAIPIGGWMTIPA
jgi:hypothetical protein